MTNIYKENEASQHTHETTTTTQVKTDINDIKHDDKEVLHITSLNGSDNTVHYFT